MSSETQEPALDRSGDGAQVHSWRDAVRERMRRRRDLEAMRSSRRLRSWSWCLVVVLHLILIAGLRIVSRMGGNRASEMLMRVELIEPQSAEPDLPIPMAAPRTRAATRALRSSENNKEKPGQVIADDNTVQALPLHVLGTDRSAVVPRISDGFHAPPGVRQYAWAQIMQRNHNPLHCRRRDRDLQAFETAGDVIARNPMLRLLGLGNPNRARLVAEREAKAAEVCDDP